MGRKLGTIVVVLVACGVLPGVATADSPLAMCVPAAANTAITTPQADGTCPTGKTKKAVANEADLTAAKARITKLEGLLKGVTRGTSHDQPTLTFSGENVRIINGANSTSALNGRGNLILGYNEAPGPQAGSHNIIVGIGDAATSYGSLVVGVNDSSEGPFETVLGFNNFANRQYGTVLGGRDNGATGDYATVSGGVEGSASGFGSSISGGLHNTARGRDASVSGGFAVFADGVASSNLGGGSTHADNDYSTYPAGP
jgi:hypothetical protein